MKLLRPMILLLMCLYTGCKNDPDPNPIEGHWKVTKLKIGGSSIPLNSCTKQSEMIIEANNRGKYPYGRLIRSSYYFDSTEMICELDISTEIWRQYNAEYQLDDGNIIDSNEGIKLNSEGQLVYFYDAWEFTNDSLGRFDTLITTPAEYFYTKTGN